MLGTIGMTLLGMVLLQATEAPDISGQWTSDEWGTVVLEAKGPGKYEGTFSLAANTGKPATGNALPGGTGGIGGAEGVSGLPGTDKGQPALGLGESAGSGIGSTNLAGAGGVMPGSSGPSAGNANSGLSSAGGVMPGLSGPSAGNANSGTLHLKWSRLERRFNGTWGKGADRSGTMSLRLVDKEIRGGFTTDEEVQLETGTPLVGDLLWKRRVVPDGGAVLLGRTDETVPTPLKIPLGDILVDVYAGRSVWYLPEKEVDKLLHSFKSLRGVTVQVHEDGEGHAFTKAVVHDPAPVRDEPAENQKREERIRTIKIAIDEALRAHKVPNVRWLDGIGKQQYFPAEWSGDPKPVAPSPSAAPGKQQKQPSQTSVTFQAIMFDMDAELITEFPNGTVHLLGPTDFGDEFKQLIDKRRVTIVSRPRIRTQIGETSRVQIGMSIAVRSPDKGEMMNRIVGETLLMTPREVDGEIVLNIQFTSEQPLKDVAQPEEDVTLQSNTFSFQVPLKKYERNGVVLGPFVMPNKKLRCIHLVKEDNNVDQQNASLSADRELPAKTLHLDDTRKQIRTNIAELEELKAEQLKSGQSTEEVDAGIARLKVKLLEVGFEPAENGSVPRELPAKTPHLDDIRKQIRTNIAELEELKAEQLKSGQSTKEVDAGIARLKVKLLEVGFEPMEETNRRMRDTVSNLSAPDSPQAAAVAYARGPHAVRIY